jgi:hypothetical protein
MYFLFLIGTCKWNKVLGFNDHFHMIMGIKVVTPINKR